MTNEIKTNEIKTTGTCACCFGTFVVKKGVMVLHGYKRPGIGYIIGNCPATRTFKPYEVSVEGTKYMLGLATDYLHVKTNYLKSLKAGEIKSFVVKTKSPAYLAAKGLVRIYMPDSQRFVNLTVVKGDGQKEPGTYSTVEWYETALKSAIYETEQTIDSIESDIKFLNGKIAEWKPVNLEVKLADAAAKIAEEAKTLCPGSGTYDHDRSRMAYAYFKGGKCKHCGHFVTASSTGKMRKHKPDDKK